MSNNSVSATLRLADYDVAEPPRPDDLAKLPALLTNTLTAELDGARAYLHVGADELLLAAVGRTIARTIGAGHVSVDVVGNGGFRLSLACTTVRQASATKALRAVHRAFASVDHGHRRLGSADVLFSYTDTVPESAYRQMLPSRGHALEVRVYRYAGLVQMDWWYDTRRFERITVEELTEQFPLALIELTSEAVPLIHGASEIAMAEDAFALADS